MARFCLGRSLRWVVFALACLGGAYVLLLVSMFLLHPVKVVPASPKVEAAVLALTAPRSGSPMGQASSEAVTSREPEASRLGGEKTFSISVDLDGDGTEETIVGVGAAGADKVAEFTDPGDVYVCVGQSMAEVPEVLFACRSAVPADLLPGFFEAQLVHVVDLDQDGLDEVVLVWLEQYWWPTAYRPLAVLQFNPVTQTFEMVIVVQRSVCEIGDYAAADVDNDGRTEILEINPIYGSDINPEDGMEEFECHFCPHRYEVRAFEFTGNAFVADMKINGGEPFVTTEKHAPYLGDGPVSSFLSELVAAARGLVRSP